MPKTDIVTGMTRAASSSGRTSLITREKCRTICRSIAWIWLR